MQGFEMTEKFHSKMAQGRALATWEQPVQRHRHRKRSDVFRPLKAVQFCWSLKCERIRCGAEAREGTGLRRPDVFLWRKGNDAGFSAG